MLSLKMTPLPWQSTELKIIWFIVPELYEPKNLDILSRSCAFQRGIDKARTLPLKLPKRWHKNAILLFLLIKRTFTLIEVCYKVSLCYNIWQQYVEKVFLLSNGGGKCSNISPQITDFQKRRLRRYSGCSAMCTDLAMKVQLSPIGLADLTIKHLH